MVEEKEFEVIEEIREVLRSGQKEYQALATPPSGWSLLLQDLVGVLLLTVEEFEVIELIREVLKLPRGIPSIGHSPFLVKVPSS